MLIKAAINGGRSKAEHPAVPVTPDEIASDVVYCLNAGASAIHFHTRSQDGFESLASEDVARCLQAVRSVSSTARVGVSTAAWIIPEPSKRLHMVSAWTVLPDFASVNFDEEGALEVSQALLAKGVGVEAGLSNVHAVEQFVSSGLKSRCLRILIEPLEQDVEKARATVKKITAVLHAERIDLPRLLHGFDQTTWNLMADAIELGYGIRVGFEDTLRSADGTLARTNSELVEEAIGCVVRKQIS